MSTNNYLRYTVILEPRGTFKGEIPRSDTLFGAISWALLLLYGPGTLDDWLSAYTGHSPPALLSSCFPCKFDKVEGKRYFYLPMPAVGEFPLAELRDHSLAKHLKKTRFIDIQIWEALREGEIGWNHIIENLAVKGSPTEDEESATYIIDGMFLRHKGNQAPQIKSASTAGTAVNRLTGGALEGFLFYTNRIYFVDTVTYFLLYLDPDWEKKLFAALKFLEDRGIGGGVTRGSGAFDLEVTEGFPFADENEGENWLNLSLYFPQKSEWEHIRNSEGARYSIVQRRGRIESSFYEGKKIWKRPVMMMEEGSLLPVMDSHPVYGGLIPVLKLVGGGTAMHYGFGFPVKVRGGAL